MQSNEKLSSLSDIERLEYLLRTIRVEVHPDFEKEYNPDIGFQLIKNDLTVKFNSRALRDMQPHETREDVLNENFRVGYKRSIFITLIVAAHLLYLRLFAWNKVFDMTSIPEHFVVLKKTGEKFKLKPYKSYPATHHKEAWGYLVTMSVSRVTDSSDS